MGNNTYITCYDTATNVISFVNAYKTSNNLTLTVKEQPQPDPEPVIPTSYTFNNSYGTWTVDLTKNSIKKYTGTASYVITPSSVVYEGKSYKLDLVEKHAFKDNDTMQVLDLQGIRQVDPEGVYNCSALEIVYGRNELKVLASYALYFNPNLEVVYLYHTANTVVAPSAVNNQTRVSY